MIPVLSLLVNKRWSAAHRLSRLFGLQLNVVISEAIRCNEEFFRLACLATLCCQQHLLVGLGCPSGPAGLLPHDLMLVFLIVVEGPIVLFELYSDAAVLILLTLRALAYTLRCTLSLVAVLTRALPRLGPLVRSLITTTGDIMQLLIKLAGSWAFSINVAVGAET